MTRKHRRAPDQTPLTESVTEQTCPFDHQLFEVKQGSELDCWSGAQCARVAYAVYREAVLMDTGYLKPEWNELTLDQVRMWMVLSKSALESGTIPTLLRTRAGRLFVSTLKAVWDELNLK